MESNKLNTIDRVELGVSFLLRFSLFIAAITGFFIERWILIFISTLAFILTFLPALIERNYRIKLPIEFELIYVFFIYSSIFLGEAMDYYDRFWWWDDMLHSLASINLGMIGFMILFVLYSKKVIKARPFFIALFSFSFSVALGTLWEIYEFGMDTFLGLNMQSNGINDTMNDLIVDCLGALGVSIFGFIYLKYHEGVLFKSIVWKFIKINPFLFKTKYSDK